MIKTFRYADTERRPNASRRNGRPRPEAAFRAIEKLTSVHFAGAQKEDVREFPPLLTPSTLRLATWFVRKAHRVPLRVRLRKLSSVKASGGGSVVPSTRTTRKADAPAYKRRGCTGTT